MNSIQEQIEALTQELCKSEFPINCHTLYCFNGIDDVYMVGIGVESFRMGTYSSTNKAEVEEYADCYRRLKLYQLLGKKAEKEYPLCYAIERRWGIQRFGTSFTSDFPNGQIITAGELSPCVLGRVWFAREEDRLNALKICGIDKAFQERCAKYGLGGAR